MKDLEDFFFKHDVYKDKEDDEVGHNARPINSDSEASEDDAPPSGGARSVNDASSAWKSRIMPERIKRATQMRQRHQRSRNAGPKGVLNDYKEFKKQEAIENERNDLIRKATLMRIANGYVAASGDAHIESVSILNTAESNQHDSDDDDEFLAKFRAQRLKELSERDTRPRFTRVSYISPTEFVDLVNNADSRTSTVIHLYESFVPICQTVNSHLQTLASRYPCVNFCALEASKSDSTISHDTLPIFMLYRGPEMVDTIVEVSKQLEGDFSLENIEWILQDYNGLGAESHRNNALCNNKLN